MMRNAQINDLTFIMNLIITEAKNGHFNSEILSSIGKINFQKDLSSILTNKTRLNGITAYALIWEENGKPVGFIIMSGLEGNKGNELWMVAVSIEYRNKGFGEKMILEILSNFKNKNLILMARCSRNSEVMYQILLKNGFQHHETSENNTRALLFMD